MHKKEVLSELFHTSLFCISNYIFPQLQNSDICEVTSNTNPKTKLMEGNNHSSYCNNPQEGNKIFSVTDQRGKCHT
jgi:hypothetical protein